MILNIVNVERLVFYDDRAWRMMPDLVRLRDQWRVSKLSPDLMPTGRRAMSEFLRLARGRYEPVLSGIFGEDVTIDNIDSRTVRNIEFDPSDDSPEIPDGEYSGFAVHREENRVFVTLWR